MADGIAQSLTTSADDGKPWNYQRSAWIIVWGTIVSGFAMSHWFKLLARLFPDARTSLPAFALKLATNQLVLSPGLNGCFFAFVIFTRQPPIARMTRDKLARLNSKLRTDLLPCGTAHIEPRARPCAPHHMLHASCADNTPLAESHPRQHVHAFDSVLGKFHCALNDVLPTLVPCMHVRVCVSLRSTLCSSLARSVRSANAKLPSPSRPSRGHLDQCLLCFLDDLPVHCGQSSGVGLSRSVVESSRGERDRAEPERRNAANPGWEAEPDVGMQRRHAIDTFGIHGHLRSWETDPPAHERCEIREAHTAVSEAASRAVRAPWARVLGAPLGLRAVPRVAFYVICRL